MNTVIKDIRTIANDVNIRWDSFNNVSIFITGATGLIGSLIVRVLLEKKRAGVNLKIYAHIRDLEKGKKMLGNEVEFVVGDIRDRVTLPESVDYIIHCAAVTVSKYMVTNPVETIATAIKGTENILELAKCHPLKSFLYLSSMEIYGVTNEEQNPITEERLGFIDLTNLRSSYSEGKRICELMCNAYFSEYGVPIKSARLAQTFGAGIPITDNRVSMQFAKSVLNGENIVLHTEGKSVSNFCYTTDSIRGLFTILTKGENGQAYNVCNDRESRTIVEVADIIANEVADGQIKVVFDIPEGNRYGYAPDATMRLCSDMLRKLGWEPQVDMKSAYERLIDYLKESV